MAAVKTAEYTCPVKVKLGETKYAYIGEYTLGKEYLTGGFTVAAEAETRYKLPEKVDFAFTPSAGGVSFELLSNGKLKATYPVTKAAGEEVTSAADLTATVGKVKFYIIGT